MKYIIFLLALSPCFAETLIAVDRIDGGVSVIVPVRAARLGESEAQRLESIRLESWQPDYVSWTLVEREVLPQDRYFRNAWRLNVAGNGLRVPRAAAEAVHRAKLLQRIRAKRSKWAEKKIICDAEGDTAGSLQCSQRLQSLRSAEATDLTTPATLEQLKDCVPWVLKEADPTP